mgnify:CR=1 FL=1
MEEKGDVPDAMKPDVVPEATPAIKASDVDKTAADLQASDLDQYDMGDSYQNERPYKTTTDETLANIFLQVIQTGGKFSLKNKKDYLKTFIA